jgi:hypothetical protein
LNSNISPYILLYMRFVEVKHTIIKLTDTNDKVKILFIKLH